jgi:hypothetical protein
VPGLAAAGDVTDAPDKQVVIAAGQALRPRSPPHRYLMALPVRLQQGKQLENSGSSQLRWIDRVVR